MPKEGKTVSLYLLAQKLGIEPKQEWKKVFINRVCSPRKVENPCAVVVSEKRHLKELKGEPTLLVVKRGLKPQRELKNSLLIEVQEPKYALAVLLSLIYPQSHPSGVSKKASLGENVVLGKGVYIGDFVYIGNNVRLEDNVKIYPGSYIGDNVHIGEGSVIYPNVTIFPNTLIGRNVRIYPGAVVGKEGFGFSPFKGEHIRLPHVGTTIIEDNAEIGANSCVDRALLEETVVGEGSKVDNLVQIGHNCRLGKGVILVSQVGLSGSVEVGDYSVLAGQVGVADHIKIGKGVTVVAKSGVAKDLKEGKVYGANLPAVEWSRWRKIYALLLKLPQLFEKIKNLKG